MQDFISMAEIFSNMSKEKQIVKNENMLTLLTVKNNYGQGKPSYSLKLDFS